MSEERWLPIPGYEGRYDVSDRGRVRSWLQRPVGVGPRVMVQVPNRRGYLMVGLFSTDHRNSAGIAVARTSQVHCLVALAFIGPRPEGMETRHLDGDQVNNTPGNLAYGTTSENAYDRVRHGTDPNARKTHCYAGHEFSEENTYLFGGRRHCRECRSAASRRSKARQMAGAS